MERTVSCGTARRLAWESSGASVLPVERGRAVAHIAACDDCRRFQTDMQRLRAVTSRLASEVPDAAFVARLRGATAEAHRQRAIRRRVGVALTMAAAVAIVVRWLPATAPHRLTDTIVAQQPGLLAEPGIEDGNAAVVQGWLSARLPQQVHVPTFENARLLGAALTRVDRVTAAVIRFQVGTQYVTYTITPARDDLASEPTVVRSDAGSTSVVAWQDGMLQHVWVGSVSAPYLTTLARSCAAQARLAMRTSRRTPGDLRPRSTPLTPESRT